MKTTKEQRALLDSIIANKQLPGRSRDAATLAALRNVLADLDEAKLLPRGDESVSESMSTAPASCLSPRPPRW